MSKTYRRGAITFAVLAVLFFPFGLWVAKIGRFGFFAAAFCLIQAVILGLAGLHWHIEAVAAELSDEHAPAVHASQPGW